MKIIKKRWHKSSSIHKPAYAKRNGSEDTVTDMEIVELAMIIHYSISMSRLSSYFRSISIPSTIFCFPPPSLILYLNRKLTLFIYLCLSYKLMFVLCFRYLLLFYLNWFKLHPLKTIVLTISTSGSGDKEKIFAFVFFFLLSLPIFLFFIPRICHSYILCW